MLLMEGDVPGAAGSIIHFYTVATYNLQHPASMNFTAAAISGLREIHARVLDDMITLEELRQQTRARAHEAGRVTRRTGETLLRWPGRPWPMTCWDVCAGGPGEYRERVVRWAEVVREKLDRELGSSRTGD